MRLTNDNTILFLRVVDDNIYTEVTKTIRRFVVNIKM